MIQSRRHPKPCDRILHINEVGPRSARATVPPSGGPETENQRKGKKRGGRRRRSLPGSKTSDGRRAGYIRLRLSASFVYGNKACWRPATSPCHSLSVSARAPSPSDLKLLSSCAHSRASPDVFPGKPSELAAFLCPFPWLSNALFIGQGGRLTEVVRPPVLGAAEPASPQPRRPSPY